MSWAELTECVFSDRGLQEERGRPLLHWQAMCLRLQDQEPSLRAPAPQDQDPPTGRLGKGDPSSWQQRSSPCQVPQESAWTRHGTPCANRECCLDGVCTFEFLTEFNLFYCRCCTRRRFKSQ